MQTNVKVVLYGAPDGAPAYYNILFRGLSNTDKLLMYLWKHLVLTNENTQFPEEVVYDSSARLVHWGIAGDIIITDVQQQHPQVIVIKGKTYAIKFPYPFFKTFLTYQPMNVKWYSVVPSTLTFLEKHLTEGGHISWEKEDYFLNKDTFKHFTKQELYSCFVKLLNKFAHHVSENIPEYLLKPVTNFETYIKFINYIIDKNLDSAFLLLNELNIETIKEFIKEV